MAYESITVENMSPACGANITGADLAGGVSNQQFDEIHTALSRQDRYLPGPGVTETPNILSSHRFGDLQLAAVSGFEKTRTTPKIDILEYDDSNPPHVGRQRPLAHWTSWVERNHPWEQAFYARNIPPEGGDTIWVNSAAAYEGLSGRMKTHLEGLHAYNDSYQPYDEHVRPELWAKDYQIYKRQQKAEYTPALHPVIRTHPENWPKRIVR